MAETTAVQTVPRVDPHVIITDKIIEKLKSGVAPWYVANPLAGPPVNLVTKEPYRGINALLLMMADCDQNLFITFDQVNSLGGKVKAHSKGYTVARWEKPANTGQAGTGDGKQQSFMKLSTVFNIEQCEIPASALPSLAQIPAPVHPDSFLQSMPLPPKVFFEKQTGYYDLLEDTIHIEKMKRKKDLPLYYFMLLHLLAHSTGHDSRLARMGVAEMGEQVEAPLYSKEELTAAICTSFLLVKSGSGVILPCAPDYLNAWSAILEADKRLIFRAAADAQKAYDYMLGKQQPETPSEP